MSGWGKKIGGLLKKPRVTKHQSPTDEIKLVPLRFLPSLCLGCSACTLTCQAVADGTAPSWFEPKLRFISTVENEKAFGFPCETCGQCVASCPFGVPLHRHLL